MLKVMNTDKRTESMKLNSFPTGAALWHRNVLYFHFISHTLLDALFPIKAILIFSVL